MIGDESTDRFYKMTIYINKTAIKMLNTSVSPNVRAGRDQQSPYTQNTSALGQHTRAPVCAQSDRSESDDFEARALSEEGVCGADARGATLLPARGEAGDGTSGVEKRSLAGAEPAGGIRGAARPGADAAQHCEACAASTTYARSRDRSRRARWTPAPNTA